MEDCFNVSTESYDASQDLFESPSTWKGLPLSKIPHNLQLTVPSPSDKDSTREDRWDTHYVRMPFSKHCLQPTTNESTGRKELKLKWNLIREAFESKIQHGKDLEKCILSYNLSGRWNFDGLIEFFDEDRYLTEDELHHLINAIIPGMKRLCLSLPEILPIPLKLLKRQSNDLIYLKQSQIAALLANAFFCTFPRRNATGKRTEYCNFPDINFNRLFESFHGMQQPEKLKCLFNYFRRRSLEEKSGNDGTVLFRRRFLERMPAWNRSKNTFKELHVNSAGTIENEGCGMLQVDFANAMVGGGVLGHGCVQEEIRFLICPELIISRLFVERLEDNECLVVSGFEQYNTYNGYASTFAFAGNFQDKSEIVETSDSVFIRQTSIVAIDALRFEDSRKQYHEENIRRELNKAYVGFYCEASDNAVGVATGNWGCGAFGGDPQLKSIIQLMAASEAGRGVAYFTFGDEDLRNSIYDTYKILVDGGITIGRLYEWLRTYSHVSSSKTVFEFIAENVQKVTANLLPESASPTHKHISEESRTEFCVVDMETTSAAKKQTKINDFFR